MKTPTHAAVLGGALMMACAGPEAGMEAPGIEAVVVSQWSDSTELFLEYPHPVAGVHTGNWAIHLTDLGDFQPIHAGEVTVTFTRGGATTDAFTIDAPLRDGIFLLDPAVTSPGTYEVTLALTSAQVNSVHVLPAVEVFASLDEAPRETTERESGGPIPFLKEQQWVIPFAVAPAEEAEVRSSTRAPAELVPPDGALVQVSAPMDGIAPAEVNRGAPSVGTRVARGQVLAVLAPSAQQTSFVEVRGRVEDLEREVARTERLVAAGALPQRRLEEARHDLGIARAELDALGGASEENFTLSLRSPLAGVVAQREFIPGGRVSAGVPLFTVVDPSTAWLRTQLPVARVGELARVSARFTVEGSADVHETGRLLSVGTVVDPRTRTVPVVYEIPDASGRFAFGQIGEVAVPLGDSEVGVTIPDAAVLDDNGTPVAYVQLGGEEFERRALTLGASDGSRVIVRNGIRVGDRVVVTGAYQVRLASLSGNEFAGGHTH